MQIDQTLMADLDRWIAEDVGAGDATALAVIPADATIRATIVAKAPGVIAGTALAAPLMARFDPDVQVHVETPDGAPVTPGQVVLRLDGPARAIVTGERLLLNLLGRLGGVATRTRAFVDALGARASTHDVALLDTRKTTPGLRRLEKHAVACGGGTNHRMGLDDAILIKENHLIAAGAKRDAAGFADAIGRALANPGGLTVQVEVETLDELRWALDAGATSILLDNMSPETMARARALAPDATLEASGNVSESTVAAIADSGVDRISVGAVTHSAPALDLSLRFVIE